MLTFRLFIRALFTGKIKIVTFFTIATFTLGTFFSLIHKFEVLSKILSDIGIAFLAAILVTAFDAIKGDRASHLIKLLSLNTAKKTVIIIPQFDKGEILLDENVPTKKISLKEIPSVSKTDCLTAYRFVSLFSSHNLETPDLITDKEALSILEDDEKMAYYGNFISIGLVSNQFSKLLSLNKSLKNVISFDHSDLDQSDLDTSGMPLPGKKRIRLYQGDGNWHSYRPDALEGSDLALFLKGSFKTNAGADYNVIICGGLNATGTEQIGSFIHKRWDEILSLKIGIANICKHKNCLLIFKINGTQGTRLDKSARIEPHPLFVNAF